MFIYLYSIQKATHVAKTPLQGIILITIGNGLNSFTLAGLTVSQVKNIACILVKFTGQYNLTNKRSLILCTLKKIIKVGYCSTIQWLNFWSWQFSRNDPSHCRFDINGMGLGFYREKLEYYMEYCLSFVFYRRFCIFNFGRRKSCY